MDVRQHVKSLKKALRVLAFLNQHGEATVSEVAHAIGIPRTTSQRLLETLASEGYAEKQPHSDFYRLTSLVGQLSSGFGERDLIVEIAKPLVEAFGHEVGWPVALATPRGCDMVVRVATDHDTSLAIDRYTIGFATPILYAPSGFCYLAYCTDAEREAVLEQSRGAASSPPVLGNGEYLSFMLEHVRTKGFCNIRFSEYLEGGVAVPLLVGGRIIGGIVMRYIKSTLNASQIEDHFAPPMMRLAADISVACENRMAKMADTGMARSAPRAIAL